MWKQYEDDFDFYKNYKSSVNRVISVQVEIKKGLEKGFSNMFCKTCKIAWFVKYINHKRYILIGL